MSISIAIDGPSGAGKSTLAKSVSKELDYLYVDTGAIYRTIGYAALVNKRDPKDAAAVAAMLPDLEIGLCYGADGLQHMTLNGKDVTEQIRLPETSLYASAVSAHPAVRAHLLGEQRGHGWPGYRNRGAPGRNGENFPHSITGGAGPPPLP